MEKDLNYMEYKVEKQAEIRDLFNPVNMKHLTAVDESKTHNL